MNARIPAPAICRDRLYAGLMAYARNPWHLPTLAFAGVIARAWKEQGRDQLPLAGLDPISTRRLLERYFPAADIAFHVDWGGLGLIDHTLDPLDEAADLVELLLAHRSFSNEETLWLAHAVATACRGQDHLWQDLGMPSRAGLSELMRTCFAPLAAKNVGDMKWKKFFYRQLCEQAEVLICKAPSCGVCSDYRHCFGSEDEPVSQVAAG